MKNALLFFTAGAGYLLLAHIAVANGQAWLYAASLLWLLLAITGKALLRGDKRSWGILTATCLVMGGLLYHDAYTSTPSYTPWLLYTPSIVMPLLMAVFFLRSLAAGKTALISTLASHIRQQTLGETAADVPPALAAYTRMLTWGWGIGLCLMAAWHCVLAASGHSQLWLLWSQYYSPLCVAAASVLEYGYRSSAYRHYRHPTLKQYVQGMVGYKG